jgi:hypothetical protein
MRKKILLAFIFFLFVIILSLKTKLFQTDSQKIKGTQLVTQIPESENSLEIEQDSFNIEFVIPDDYTITNKMIESSSKDMECDLIYALDQSWFVDTQQGQALIINLETDYHRLKITHFNLKSSLSFALDNIDFYMRNPKNNRVMDKLDSVSTTKNLSFFLQKAEVVSGNYFITKNGLKLGLPSKFVSDKLGKPHSITPFVNGYIMNWSYPGSYENNKVFKQYAKNSFGYSISIQFIDEKANAIIIQNKIP